MKLVKLTAKYIVGVAVAVGILISVVLTPSANANQFNKLQTTAKVAQSNSKAMPNLDDLETKALELLAQDDPDSAQLYKEYLIEYDTLTQTILGEEGDSPEKVEDVDLALDLLANGKYKDVIDLYNSYHDQLFEKLPQQ